jgi:hypothetical protein
MEVKQGQEMQTKFWLSYLLENTPFEYREEDGILKLR